MLVLFLFVCFVLFCGWNVLSLFLFFVCVCVFFLCFFVLFFCRVKGSGEVARRATSLGPKPSLVFGFCFFFFVFWVFFVCFFCFCFCVFVHLALNPPYLFFCVFSSLPFLSLVFNRKTLFSPPKKAILFICLCFHLLLFGLCLGLPLFSLSLSLSLSCYFFLASFLFFISVSGSCFVSLFCFFVSRCYFVFVFSACCLALFWIIMFDFLLLCILFSYSCCFWFFVAFIFCFLLISTTYQKTSLKKWKLQKKTKMKNAQKSTLWQEQLAQVCSQIVSFFLFCISLNLSFFAENTIKYGVSAQTKNTKKTKKASVKNWSKLALKTGPSMLRNKIGPVFHARNGSFVFVCFLFVFEKSSSFCRENEIFKNKKNKKNLDQFLTLEKAKIGPVFNSTACIYMFWRHCWGDPFGKTPKMINSLQTRCIVKTSGFTRGVCKNRRLYWN